MSHTQAYLPCTDVPLWFYAANVTHLQFNWRCLTFEWLMKKAFQRRDLLRKNLHVYIGLFSVPIRMVSLSMRGHLSATQRQVVLPSMHIFHEETWWAEELIGKPVEER